VRGKDKVVRGRSGWEEADIFYVWEMWRGTSGHGGKDSCTEVKDHQVLKLSF
jgi:hypothetical protein